VLFKREISIPLRNAVNALSLNPFVIAGCLPPFDGPSALGGPVFWSHRFKLDHCSRAAEESGTVLFRGAKSNPRSDRQPVRNWTSEEV